MTSRMALLLLLLGLLGLGNAYLVGGLARDRRLTPSYPGRTQLVMMAKKKAPAGGKSVQVVLNEPIKGIGKKGELVTVKSTYAENVIVRGGKGVIATPETLDKIAADSAAAAAAAVAAKAQAVKDEETLTKVFGESGLLIKKKVGPDGAIFGSVTPAEVAAGIKEHAGIAVDKKQVKAPDVKSVGTSTCEINLHKEVAAKIKLVVVSEAS